MMKDIIYVYLRIWMRITIRVFHRQIDVVGLEHVPKKGPLIFAMNHPNALTDPLITLSSVPNFIHFLTRGDLFASKIVAFIFDILKMLPIYRQHDGKTEVQKNLDVFNSCVKILGQQNSVGIYPEGSHMRVHKIRPIKKGMARIAFMAEEQHDFTLGVKIIPLGLTYKHHQKFRQPALLSFGKPIEVSDYFSEYAENQGQAIAHLSQDTRKALQGLTLNIQDPTQYECIDSFRKFYVEATSTSKSQTEAFQIGQHCIDQLQQWLSIETNEITPWQSKLTAFNKGLDKLNLRHWVLKESPASLVKLLIQSVGLLLLSPLFLFGFLIHILPATFAHHIAISKFKDDHYHSSIQIVMGYLGFPIWYLLLTLVMWAFTSGWVALAFLVAMPIGGLFAITYWGWMKKTWARWRMRGSEEKLRHLKELRRELIEFLGFTTDYTD